MESDNDKYQAINLAFNSSVDYLAVAYFLSEIDTGRKVTP